VSEFDYWTAADSAELDVLTYALVGRLSEHRERCDACQPCSELASWRRHLEVCKACQHEAPLTYGGPCRRHAEFVAHGDKCSRCIPCPAVTKMIGVVVEWRDWRVLRSKAEWLRKWENEREREAA
jgi:hypothetical protein